MKNEKRGQCNFSATRNGRFAAEKLHRPCLTSGATITAPGGAAHELPIVAKQAPLQGSSAQKYDWQADQLALILGIVAILRETNDFLSAQSPVRLVALSFLLIMVVGAIDHLTGYEVSFSFFYLIPVSFASWYLRQRLGLIVCVVSAAIWLGVDYTSGHQYSNRAIQLWNAGIRLGFFVVVALLLERLRRALEHQESLAQLDGLTGILNALTFRQRCDLSFGLAIRHGHPLAIGYLDLDGFKGVNDSLGHSVGDQVLKAVATALTKLLRVSDIGARLGGDEFAILLPETNLAGARTFFTKLRETLIDLAVLNRWPIGFSIGVAVFHPPPANPDDAIRCADELMYKVKKSGKNNILVEEYTGVTCGAELSRRTSAPGRQD